MLLALSVAFAGEVTLWHAWRGDERAALDAASAAWNAVHAESPVQPIFVPYEGLAAKVDAAVPRGNGPDLFIFGHERVAEWAQRGIALPTRPGDGFLAVGLEALSVGGEPHGWPLAAKSIALFRNTATVPEPPTTTDELLALAARHTHGDHFGLAWETASAYQNAPWLHGFGGGRRGRRGRGLRRRLNGHRSSGDHGLGVPAADEEASDSDERRDGVGV